MAFLGRTPSNAPLTSADIPDDIIQGGDIAYFENDSTTTNLGGTYSTERMYLNDSYTLNDNVNVTGHLALGTIADSDVVITNDSSARTITGSGTLEAGRLMNDFQSSLTGMTGELGSAVTGSPNLILSKYTKVTTITNNTETSFSNATSHYETIGSHTKSDANSIITAMVCLPIYTNTSDGMWTVPILQLQYGGTISAVQTGNVDTGGMGPQLILYGTWEGKPAASHTLKWGWNYGATSSKPGITTWNPDLSIDARMPQSATYAIVMEVFV